MVQVAARIPAELHVLAIAGDVRAAQPTLVQLTQGGQRAGQGKMVMKCSRRRARALRASFPHGQLSPVLFTFGFRPT